MKAVSDKGAAFILKLFFKQEQFLFDTKRREVYTIKRIQKLWKNERMIR